MSAPQQVGGMRLEVSMHSCLSEPPAVGLTPHPEQWQTFGFYFAPSLFGSSLADSFP